MACLLKRLFAAVVCVKGGFLCALLGYTATISSNNAGFLLKTFIKRFIIAAI